MVREVSARGQCSLKKCSSHEPMQNMKLIHPMFFKSLYLVLSFNFHLKLVTSEDVSTIEPYSNQLTPLVRKIVFEIYSLQVETRKPWK